MLDAAELRRASATDAVAVQQYLRLIDSDELNALLEAFADAERKKKDDGAAVEWLALVHVLLRTSATRQRTATRILLALWRGHASEMEALRWVSEISLGYMVSVVAAESGIASELHTMLQIVLQFVRDAIGADATASTRKALPQLLALVPVLLNLLLEASATRHAAEEPLRTGDSASIAVAHEHVVQLLELPWDVRSVPNLLELLREHTVLVSRDGWTQLRRSVEQLVAPPLALKVPTDCLNPLIRECLFLAPVSSGVDGEAVEWIHLARCLTRRLPAHLRQEAEFNVQMSLHQCPSLAPLICNAVADSSSAIGTNDATRRHLLALDVSDAVLLLHAIRASKPLLHHHFANVALVASAKDRDSVFGKAQRLIHEVLRRTTGEALGSGQSVRHAVASILEFGGRQQYARLWKARLLHDLARLWSDNHPEMDTGLLVLESIFCTVAEVRDEILGSIFQMARAPSQTERALGQLRHLVGSHTRLVDPCRRLAEDWLSSLASATSLSRLLVSGFEALAPLVSSNKDLYNFSMVLVRKQLSSPHSTDRQVAVEIWCSWLENGRKLDKLQEEEVVVAIKNAVQLTHDRLWMFQRLKRVFARQRELRSESLTEFHRLFASALSEFIESNHEVDTSNSEAETSELEDADDAEEEDGSASSRGFPGFQLLPLDALFVQNSSLAAALQLGTLFESVLLCLNGVYSSGGLGHDVTRWVDAFVRHRDEFFLWASSGGDSQLRVGESRFAWALAARVSLGCAFCSLAMRRAMERLSPEHAIPRHVWELVESQLALVRLWRKFSATTPLGDVSLVHKDQHIDAQLTETAASTIRPFIRRFLSSIVDLLGTRKHEQSRAAPSRRTDAVPAGASLDGVLFVLDVYTRTLPSSSAAADECVAATTELLGSVYCTVMASVTSLRGATLSSSSGAVFITYGEALASHFPLSMRHLVAPDTSSSLSVALDLRACDELLGRVCVGLTKTVEVLSASRPERLTSLLAVLARTDAEPTTSANDTPPLIVAATSRVFADLRRLMDTDACAKFRLASVGLVKRLVDLGKQRDDDETAGNGVVAAVTEAAYGLLCDHVVHQPPLLRALLALSFPTASPIDAQDDIAIERVAAVLRAGGFHVDQDDVSCAQAPTLGKSEQLQSTRRGSPRQRRRRLRQIEDEDEEDGEEEEEEEHEPPVGETPDENESVSSVAAVVARRQQRQPRLTTASAQTAALLSALAQLESLHSRAAQSLAVSAKNAIRPRAEQSSLQLDLLGRVERVHELLSSTVFASRDITWMNVRALAKLLSVVEGAVKVGRYCSGEAAAPLSGHNGQRTVHALMRGFERSVRVVMRGRAWLALLRDASTEPSVKSKFSSTILKLDVYLLDVPALVSSLMKSDSLASEPKRRLRVFLSTVERDLALAQSTSSAHKLLPQQHHAKDAKTKYSAPKRHLVGVVPILRAKRRKRLRSRHPFIDSCLAEEDGDDAFADLEDFIA